MRFFEASLALSALSFLSLAVHGSPIAADADLVERQAGNTFFAITGATGGVQPRLEIRDLAAKADQFNLFVLAMQRFQSKAQNGKLSYYQVSGIHGRPYVNWDGVGPYSSSPWWPGYCPHSSNLFGTWHRPYIALYEQLMIQYANEIVGEIGDAATKSRYQTAVSTLRFPYWDWAKRTTAAIMPPQTTASTISVTFPQNGTTANIPNPLYSYRFQVIPDRNFDGNYVNSRQTTRLANAESNLRASYTSRRNTLMTLFSTNQPYNNFSTDANGNTAPNLEGIHNGVHVDVGGYMNQIAYSAFDPIFALHHANVDRVIAIWQKLYTGSWVAAASQGAGTRTMAPFSTQDSSTPLTPFHRDVSGSFWTSDTVRQTSNLGYTYPDLLASNGQAISTQQLTSNLRNAYGSTSSSALMAANGDSSSATTYDYMAQIVLDKTSLGGQSCAVQFTLAGNYVASFAALALPPSPNGQSGPITSSGTVMLTDTLTAKGVNPSDRDATIKYLNQNLKWQVVSDGNQVTLPARALNVTIASAEVKPAKTNSQFATWVAPPAAITSTS
ncbi:hypothetical protein B0J12DRAFT_693548 [Macrophomina phaseolina]|uniref:tyrosinase n=1 Tax=Macrophomina phaseolina TaxID=35725 RepID=A0ABQ8GV98_9PEZI|nr:hypothetical protein B0J12DRAFT_693548 [Macrophomina phaseolina]